MAEGKNSGYQMRTYSSGPVTRRASIACISCRRRRTRCDGDSYRNTPCSLCNEDGVECRFPRHDGRKRSRSDLVQIRNEGADAIEHVDKRSLALVYPGSSASLSNRPYAFPRPNSLPSSVALSLSSRQIGRDFLGDVPKAFSSFTDVLLNTQAMRKDFALTKSGTRQQEHDFGKVWAFPSSTEVVWLSTDRHGQARYFGYTSNMQVVSTLPMSLSDSPESAMQSPARDLDEVQADQREFQAHLVDLYFTYQNPALPVVEKEAFMDGWASQERSTYFSTFLLHCILARSARLSDRPYANAVIPIYHQRIKAELLNQLENPSIATIQALCLFGHFLGSVGDDRGCWLYPGMAFRLAYDMGLHRDCWYLVHTGQLSARDRQLRISIFWGCFVVDKIYCVCQGRPSAIKLADIGIPRPSEDSVGPKHHLLIAWVHLSIILDEMNSLLNGSPEQLHTDASLNKLSTVADDLLTCLRSLPQDLCWNSKCFPAPEIWALHTQVLIAIILIHRPFANPGSSGTTTPTRRKKQLPGYTAEESHIICMQNSIRIAKMIDAFDRQYGIQKIFSVGAYIALTAAMTLVSSLATTTKPRNDAVESKKALEVCLDTLSDLGPSFPVAGRHHTILKSILKFCGDESELGRNGAPLKAADISFGSKGDGLLSHSIRSEQSGETAYQAAAQERIGPTSIQPITSVVDGTQTQCPSMRDSQPLPPHDSQGTMANAPETFNQDLTELSYDNISNELHDSDIIPTLNYTEMMPNTRSIQHGSVNQEQQTYGKFNDLMMDWGPSTNPSNWFLPEFGIDFRMTEMEAESLQMFAGDGLNGTMFDMDNLDRLPDLQPSQDYSRTTG